MDSDLVHLFERARRALTSRLQLEPVMAEVLALHGFRRPEMPAAGAAAGTTLESSRRMRTRLAAEFAIDDTGRPVVRVVDMHTRTTIREFPPTALAAVAAKLGTVIEIENQ